MLSDLNSLLSQIGHPDLVFMCGLPGSGKSYVADRIAEQIGGDVLRSDDFRFELFADHRFSNQNEAEHQLRRNQAYQAMYAAARERVKNGERIVLDATHLTANRSDIISELCVGSQCCIVTVQTPESVSRARFTEQGKDSKFIQKWEQVKNTILDAITNGVVSWPSRDRDGVPVFEYLNV